MKIKPNKISKFLALVLRHNPSAAGITLDNNGWADARTLISQVNKHYGDHVLSLGVLAEIVSDDDKNRYELNPDNSKIRARQGHSLKNVNLELQPQTPPSILYHGTVSKFMDAIHDNGLIKGSRQYVHLSGDMETAKTVGGRRGDPIILEVSAKAMHDAGLPFFKSSNGVWLTDHVPPHYISVIYEENQYYD